MSSVTTIAKAVVLVRQQVQDEDSRRWIDKELIPYGSRAESAIWGDHPEAFCETAIATSRPLALSTHPHGNAKLHISEEWVMAWVHYTAFLLRSEDNADTMDSAAAAAHYKLYLQEV